MPTFRNDTNKPIQCHLEDEGKIIIFDPKREVALDFWVPYSQLGLTLVSATYPPVPNSILIDGKFKFSKGLERIFNIEPCRSYSLFIDVKNGEALLYLEAGKNSIDITSSYTGVFNWSRVPYIRVVGIQDNSSVEIHATVER